MNNIQLKNETGATSIYEGIDTVVLPTAEGKTAKFIQNGYLEKDTSSVFKNIVDRAANFVNYKWTPEATMMLQDNNYQYRIVPGRGSDELEERYTGLPYSSVKGTDNFVGINVLPETFHTALKNPRSVLYTKYLNSAVEVNDPVSGINSSITSEVDNEETTRFLTSITVDESGITEVSNPYDDNKLKKTISAGKHNKFRALTLTKSGDGATLPASITTTNYKTLTTGSNNINACLYYGIVCSVLGKHGFDLPTYETTYSWENSFENNALFAKIFDENTLDAHLDCQFLKVGDVLMTITPSTGGGHFTLISNIEKNSAGAITHITVLESSDPLAVESRHERSSFHQAYLTGELDGNYKRVYRFIGEIPEEDNSFDLLENYSYNESFAVDKGNKSHYRRSLNNKTNEDLREPVIINNLSNESLTLHLFNEDNSLIFGGEGDLIDINWEPPTDSSKYRAISTSGLTVDTANRCVTTELIELPSNCAGKVITALYTLDTGSGAEGYSRIARVALYDKDKNPIKPGGSIFYDVGSVGSGHRESGKLNEKSLTLVEGSAYVRFCVITAADAAGTSTVTVTSFKVLLNGEPLRAPSEGRTIEIEPLDDFTIPTELLEVPGLYRISSTTDRSKMTTANTQEFYYYDTGNVEFSKIKTKITPTEMQAGITDGASAIVEMTGKLSDWTDGMTPEYVSISNVDGTLLKTAPITSLDITNKIATFSIRLDAAKLSQRFHNLCTVNNGLRLFFKAHYDHKFGICVTPMMYEA